MNIFTISFGGNYVSSNTKKQLEEVKQHIIHGRFQEGLKIIEAILKKKDISKEDKLAFLIFKAEISCYLGNFQDALQLADQVLNESEKLDNLLLKVDALTIKASALYWLAKIKEGIEIAEEGLKIISEIKNLPTKELAERKARLLLFKTQFELQLGYYEKGIDATKEALSYAEDSGNKFIISQSLATLGYFYMYLENKLEKNEEYLEKAHILAADLGNNFLLSMISISFAHLSYRRRKYEEAIDFFNKAFNLSKEIGSTLLLMYIHDLGNVYLNGLYKLDKALECYQESLKYGVILKHIPYINIGYIYFLKNELEKAQDYYQKSLKISEEIGDRRVLPNILFNLISLSIELKKFEQAKQYQNRLEEIEKETSFEHIIIRARFASILVLKASGEISDLVEASKKLDEFLVIDNLPISSRLDALYSLLEIRIKELQITSNESTLEEVKKQAFRLEVEAEEQHYH
ncbi:MAG: tetratricopeptide repeat protein, partial [Asgard group archaeon]|nr:tetratricopeptide repeat protein [Asgard group archaeon]